MPVARRCVKTLRRQERPVDCGDIVRRSGHGRPRPSARGAARADRRRRPLRPRRPRAARENLQRGERPAIEKNVSDQPKDHHRYVILRGNIIIRTKYVQQKKV